MVRGLDLPLRSAGPVEATRLIPGLVMLGACVPMPFSFGVVSRTHQPFSGCARGMVGTGVGRETPPQASPSSWVFEGKEEG